MMRSGTMLAMDIFQLMSVPNRPFGIVALLVLGFASGVFFAAVYIRCKNIWVVVLLHFAFNWLSNVSNVLIRPDGEMADITIEGVIINILIAIVFFFIGIFLIRNKKSITL